MEFAQKATKDAKRWGTNSEGQVKYCRCTFFGHATPDHAGARPGARPYRVQCRVARCGMGIPSLISHPLSRLFACFAGPKKKKSSHGGHGVILVKHRPKTGIKRLINV